MNDICHSKPSFSPNHLSARRAASTASLDKVAPSAVRTFGCVAERKRKEKIRNTAR